jgi:hypothetical protein
MRLVETNSRLAVIGGCGHIAVTFRAPTTMLPDRKSARSGDDTGDLSNSAAPYPRNAVERHRSPRLVEHRWHRSQRRRERVEVQRGE